MRLRLDLGYDGTAFHGWAVQPGLRTVAGELGGDFLARLADRPDAVPQRIIVMELLADRVAILLPQCDIPKRDGRKLPRNSCWISIKIRSILFRITTNRCLNLKFFLQNSQISW